MVYKLGRVGVRNLRVRLLCAAALLGAFVVGGATAAAILLHINRSLSLTGSINGGVATKPNSGKRSPTLAANSVLSSKTAASKVGSDGTKTVDTAGLRIANCLDLPARSGLSSAAVPQLKKLAEYEQVCPGAAETVSFFVGTPTNLAEAQDEAQWVASVLKEFSGKHVKPLVFMEPTGGGGVLDAKQYRNGAYDAALDAFFAAMKAQGVSDAMMGVWVPWPEGNIPVWTSVDPGDFAANVTKVVQFQKKHFPGSKAAVLLESKSYPSANSWSGGAYVSLLPYVQSIPKGLIDSFGLQGFAWPPTSPGEAPMLDPSTFLRVDLAAEAANSLGAKEAWFNTGVFSKSYVVSKTNPFVLSAQQRQTVLNGIVSQAKILKGKGFGVSVHIFAKDKSNLGEAIDWSYWPSGQQATSASTPVLKTFVSDLQKASVGFWLYDSTE